jgi:RHS repeat-associated protein
VAFRYGYTGREQDGETGLDYYRARYYDVANGRFISEDPIKFSAGDGNLTRYVRNNPVNGNDPSGLEGLFGEWDPIGDGVKWIFGGIVVVGGVVVKKIGDTIGDAVVQTTSPGTLPLNRQGTPIVFDPNYGRHNQPEISFSPVHIRSNTRFNLLNHTTFPCTGGCLIGGSLPGFYPGKGRQDHLFIPYFGANSIYIPVGQSQHGTASTLGDLSGISKEDARKLFELLGATYKPGKNHDTYKFKDKSQITIRHEDNRVTKGPASRYASDNRNVNKGLKLSPNGELLRTRDELGNEIYNTHDTGEFLK